MCLILFSYNEHEKYRLILAANRDEFYARPTDPISKWNSGSGIIAGKDLEAGGTWMGITPDGKFAALTNHRDPKKNRKDVLSRGLLVSDYLEKKEHTPESYLGLVSGKKSLYNGFNLLAGDGDDLFYFSNVEGMIKKLEPGLYGLSNHFLNTPWPKVQKGMEGLRSLVSSGGFSDPEKIFSLLSDPELPEDKLLPDTGMGMEWERILAPLFIKSEIYGTRSSSLLLISHDNTGVFTERTWIKKGTEVQVAGTRRIIF